MRNVFKGNMFLNQFYGGIEVRRRCSRKRSAWGGGLCTENVSLMKRDISGSLEIFQLLHSEITLDIAERALTIVL